MLVNTNFSRFVNVNLFLQRELGRKGTNWAWESKRLHSQFGYGQRNVLEIPAHVCVVSKWDLGSFFACPQPFSPHKKFMFFALH